MACGEITLSRGPPEITCTTHLLFYPTPLPLVCACVPVFAWTPTPSSTWLEVAIETPLVIFRLSVLFVLAHEIRRRNVVFSTSFFVLYCVQSVAAIVYYSAVSDVHLRTLNHSLVDRVLLEQGTGTSPHGTQLIVFIIVDNLTWKSSS